MIQRGCYNQIFVEIKDLVVFYQQQVFMRLVNYVLNNLVYLFLEDFSAYKIVYENIDYIKQYLLKPKLMNFQVLIKNSEINLNINQQNDYYLKLQQKLISVNNIDRIENKIWNEFIMIEFNDSQLINSDIQNNENNPKITN